MDPVHGRHHRGRLLLIEEVARAGHGIHSERVEQTGERCHLLWTHAGPAPCSAHDEAHRAADLAEVRREPLALARLRHRQIRLERPVQIARGPGRVAVHDLIGHPRRIARRGDQAAPDLGSDQSRAAEQLDPGCELDRPTETAGRSGLGGAAVERHDAPNQIGPPIREPVGDCGADRMRDDDRVANAQEVECGGHSIGLGGERIVGVLGPGRGADPERLDHDRAVPRVDEPRQHAAVAKRRSEQPRNEHDGVARSADRYPYRLGRREGD